MKNEKSHQTCIAISGIGLSCITGNQPFALYGAIAGNIINSRELGIEVEASEEDDTVISPLCVAADVIESDKPAERMLELAGSALSQIINKIDQDIDHSKVLCCILLPSLDEARGSVFSDLYAETYLKQWVTNRHLTVKNVGTSFGEFHYRFRRADEGAAKVLSECCQDLSEDKWQAVLFGGTDSLINEMTSIEMAQEGRLKTKESPNGQVLGEGAAFVLLEINKTTDDTDSLELRTTTFNEEPHTRCADNKKLHGLANALNGICKNENITPEEIETMILPFGAETIEQLEWHQVQQQIWPTRIDEKQRLAMQVGEIEAPQPEPKAGPEIIQVSRVTGNVGAATIPIALALSCGRFEYHHPSIKNMVICDTGDYPIRGAIMLSHNKKAKENSQEAA